MIISNNNNTDAEF